MKRFLLTASLLASMAGPALAGEVTVSGDVGAVSDYRNRGISRTDEGPALQGRIQLDHISGIYGGVKGSTVNMRLDDDANVEGILFGGYKGNFDGIEYDAKLTYNSFLGSDLDDLDYAEFEFTGGYDFDVFYASLTWALSPDYINGSGASLYYGGDIIVPIQTELTAKAHLGFEFVGDEGPYVNDNVTDWSVGLYYNWADYDVDLGIQYVDTSLDENDCVEKCGGRALVSATKDFSW